MYETLIRPHDVSQSPALQTIGQVGDKLKEAEARREDKRIRQIAEAKAFREGKPLPESSSHGEKRKRETDTPESETKRVKTEGETSEVGTASEGVNVGQVGAQVSATPAPKTQTLSKVLNEVRGHTSYLTFAVLLPASVRSAAKTVAIASEQSYTIVGADQTPTPPPPTEVCDPVGEESGR